MGKALGNYIKKQNLQPKVFFFNFKLILKLSCVYVAVFISKPYHRFRPIIPGFERVKQNCEFAARRGYKVKLYKVNPTNTKPTLNQHQQLNLES